MTLIPASVIGARLPGLDLLHEGKVRKTYRLPGHPDKRLVVVTDRISIFDFVLNAVVPIKGAALTVVNHFWRTMIGDLFPHDLIAAGSAIDEFLPEALRGNVDLQSRATVVQDLDMFLCEAIARGALTGTSLKPYRTDRRVCGHLLPPDLQDGDALPFPIFTPTTKATKGHDEHITADQVAREYGVGVERRTLQLFAFARAFARTRGIYLVDTKVEMGLGPDMTLTLGDEILTPDSSRYWDYAAWEKSRHDPKRKAPASFDKEIMRAWGRLIGLNDEKQYDPKNPDDVTLVHELNVPREFIDRTAQNYRYLPWRLTGQKLERYQNERMGINVQPSKVRIEVISGSESDVGQMMDGLKFLDAQQRLGHAEVRRHVASCHRNPHELIQHLTQDMPSDAIVIAGAGLAAALPGMVKAFLNAAGKPNVPVIGVGFQGKTDRNNIAAQTSIEELPGQPVMLDENGSAFFGPAGFEAACKSAVRDEFLPPLKPSVSKPPQFNLPLVPEA